MRDRVILWRETAAGLAGTPDGGGHSTGSGRQQHRYKAESSFSKTGVGYLSPRTTQDSLNEAERSDALTRKLTKRLSKNGKSSKRN